MGHPHTNVKYPWPEGLTRKEYDAAGPHVRAEMRSKYRFKMTGGNPQLLAKGEEPRLARGHGEPPAPKSNAPTIIGKKLTEYGKAKEQLAGLFPRTTDGAVKFIRAWQTCEDGNAFVAKYANGDASFWGAATHRATFLRNKGVKLKVLKKTKGEVALYDWDKLKMVAAEFE